MDAEQSLMHQACCSTSKGSKGISVVKRGKPKTGTGSSNSTPTPAGRPFRMLSNKQQLRLLPLLLLLLLLLRKSASAAHASTSSSSAGAADARDSKEAPASSLAGTQTLGKDLCEALLQQQQQQLQQLQQQQQQQQAKRRKRGRHSAAYLDADNPNTSCASLRSSSSSSSTHCSSSSSSTSSSSSNTDESSKPPSSKGASFGPERGLSSFRLFSSLKGRPFAARFCGSHLCIDDEPTLLIAAGVSVPSMFVSSLEIRKIFLAAREAGCNAVKLSLQWSAHAVSPFTFDFRGPLDLRGLITLAGALGLFVILEGRGILGPEVFGSSGGFVLQHSVAASWGTPEAEFQLLLHAQRWLAALRSYLDPLLASKGGPLVALMIRGGPTIERLLHLPLFPLRSSTSGSSSSTEAAATAAAAAAAAGAAEGLIAEGPPEGLLLAFQQHAKTPTQVLLPEGLEGPLEIPQPPLSDSVDPLAATAATAAAAAAEAAAAAKRKEGAPPDSKHTPGRGPQPAPRGLDRGRSSSSNSSSRSSSSTRSSRAALRPLTAEARWLAPSAAAVAATAQQQQQQQQGGAAAATLWRELEAFGLPLLAVDFAQQPAGSTAAVSAAAAAAAAFFSSDPGAWRLGRGFWRPARGPLPPAAAGAAAGGAAAQGAATGAPAAGAAPAAQSERELLIHESPEGGKPHAPTVDLAAAEGPPFLYWQTLLDSLTSEGSPPPQIPRASSLSLRRVLQLLLRVRQLRRHRRAAAATGVLAFFRQLRGCMHWEERRASGGVDGRRDTAAAKAPKPRRAAADARGAPAAEAALMTVEGGPHEEPLVFAEASWQLSRDVLLLAARGCSFFVYEMFAAPLQQDLQQQLLQQRQSYRNRLSQLRSSSSSSFQQQHMVDAWGLTEWPAFGILARLHRVLGIHFPDPES
ncbi:hypothetical protein ACSSS7_000102 [Eimeria intestinalis]